MGREFANGIGTVRRRIDTDPVGQVADIDTSGVLVLDGQGGDLGTRFGLLARLLGDAGGLAGVENALGGTGPRRGLGLVRPDDGSSGLGAEGLLQGAGVE